MLRATGLLGAVGKHLRDVQTQLTAAVSSWKPKRAPLMTRWADDLDPGRPLPEYPRPQMMREAWTNLNAVWEFQPAASEHEAAPFGQPLSGAILVPFPVESALSGVMQLHDRLWYRRSVTIPPAWRDKQVMLHFGAVDYESEVFVNGESLGVHFGGYDAFRYNITPHLKGDGAQELIVRVFDPTENGGQPRGKQTTKPHSTSYTSTTGIWQTVWMEPVNAVSIEDLKIVPDVDRSELELTVVAPSAGTPGKITVMVKDGTRTVATASGAPNVPLRVPIPKPKLWSPDCPFLYDLEVKLEIDGAITDEVKSYFGMRKISVGDVDGQKKILLNNEFVFQTGPLDQGFWPDGIYTAPTEVAIKSDIERTKSIGFNMVRKHMKVEPARWYYWTDKLGLLVWQDMPSPHPVRGVTVPAVYKAEFERELKRMIETHWNAPSIVLWTIFNERGGEFDSPRLAEMVKALDPSRLVNEASGWEVTGAGDVSDQHNYPEPDLHPDTGKQAMACGEYGGLGYPVPGHMWSGKGWGYLTLQNANDLLFFYADLMGQVKVLRDQKNMSAAVYTQLTDVETESNGLMTYDRLFKIVPETLKLATTFQFKPPSYRVLAPTSETTGQIWSYTFANPGADWATREFNDSHWSRGTGGFGNQDSAGTKWTTPDVWLRKHFNPGQLAAEDINNIFIRELHEGELEVFVNGIMAYSRGKGESKKYGGRPISPEAQASLKSNVDDVLAVHCHLRSQSDPQFVDAGLLLRVPAK